ncbi:TIGR00725 family protein [Candidatus Fermentibacteria bacterium]|nr:MAG: TIGR00725 family protein [Candidatus Fermentibacteria bacterium]
MNHLVSVIGGNSASSEEGAFAFRLGLLLAEAGFTVVCGGGAGVMEAVSRGCDSAGGTVIGILPGEDAGSGNRFLSFTIPTGMGASRNRIIALSGQVVCAVGGSYGTLSEIAFSLQAGKPVCCFGSWKDLPGVVQVNTPEEAVEFVLRNTERNNANH